MRAASTLFAVLLTLTNSAMADDGSTPSAEGGFAGFEADCEAAEGEDGQLEVAGEPCELGHGACAAMGWWVCDGEELVCTAAERAPAAELCDGIDNDCDGRTDEDTTHRGCQVGIGACAEVGTSVCVDGVAECVGHAGMPDDEVCNGVDDDCDGLVDEELCSGEAPACDPDAAEICDGIDNDCDDFIDEEAGDCFGVGEGYAGGCAVALPPVGGGSSRLLLLLPLLGVVLLPRRRRGRDA